MAKKAASPVMDDVLRTMLRTPPEPHKPPSEAKKAKSKPNKKKPA